ncbi:helix-turn-helix domain-containing protein [Sphaerisporangium album]|uniref:helix-turn-helix domain-containing protein n=1 Tax=Sphaerisporangium album TaxID=509200 RepID=UPI001C68FEA5|nr:helix-turn-helix transcriptional regulator [Sphaerisporangium album]
MREILRDSGLTARALARQAGWDETKCSRLIHARTPPSDDDIRTWCRICGAEDEIPNLIAASRSAENAYLEWRRVQRSMKRMQDLGLRLFEDNRVYRFYSSNLVPWPLQTPGYMRAIMQRFSDFHRADVPDIEDGVRTRMARRRFLDDGTRRCAMIIEESVLRNRVFGDEVMKDQFRHLLTGMRQTNLSLGIIPLAAVRVQKLTETFHIYGDNTVSIELVSAIITITQPREIDLYIRCFNDLASAAVYGDKAEALITAAIGALE